METWQRKSQKSISVLSKKGKEGAEEEYDTDSYSSSFSLLSGDGVLLLPNSLKLCLLYRDRKCQTIINSEVMQKRLIRISGLAKAPQPALCSFPRSLCLFREAEAFFFTTIWKGTCAVVPLQNEYINFSITAAICFLSHVLIALMASWLLLTLFALLFAVSKSLCVSVWLMPGARVLLCLFSSTNWYSFLPFY